MKIKHVIVAIAFLLFAPVFSQSQSIPNPGFEQMNDTLPAGWWTSQFGAGLSTVYSHSGSNSLTVWNWYYYAKGYAVNGTLPSSLTNFEEAGTPYTSKPARLKGYYRYDTSYTHSNNDSARVQVILKKFNQVSGERDTVAYGTVYLHATDAGSPAFSAFTVEINDWMPGTQPDSIAIAFESSVNGFCDAGSTGNCLYLNIDDLSLEFSDLSSETFSMENFRVYPNPVTQNLYAAEAGFSADASVKVFTVTGQCMLSGKWNANLDCQSLPAGIYVVEILDEGKLHRAKFVKD